MLGAVAGDIIGSPYEWHNIKTTDFPLFNYKSHFTDDTVMYIEKSNLVAFVTVEDDGDTSYAIYKIEGTDFTKVNTFTYYKSYDKYYVGYDSVDKDKYDSELAAAFDISKAVTVTEAAGETIDAALEAAGL